MAEPEQDGLTTLTVELLSAFVSNNTIESADLAGLIQTTHAALNGINAPPPVEPPTPEYEPAVTVRKSLGSRDHILSLIDGKPYKTLKRHLSGHGLTPAEYRARYKLPSDYPMVAPTYSEHRRDVAQRLGLGRKSVKAAVPEPVIPAPRVEPASGPSPSLAPAAKAQRKTATKAAAAKAPKPAKRVAKPVAPAPTVVAALPAADSLEIAASPPAETKPAKTAPAPKPKAPKAKGTTPPSTTAKPKSAPAERSRSKTEETPASAE